MTLNLADSADIMSAYDAVLNDELNWFLLQYSARIVDELSLYAFGIEGLEELKTKIDPRDDEQVLIGFLRVDEDDLLGDWNPGRVSGESGTEEWESEEAGRRNRRRVSKMVDEDDEGPAEAKYLLISYAAKGVVGVRRARAQVHTRRLGMVFKKHDAVLSIDDVSQLTNAAIAQSLAEPDPTLLTFSSSSSPTTVFTPGAPGAGAGAGAGTNHSSPPLRQAQSQAQAQRLSTQVDTSVSAMAAGSVVHTSPLGSPTVLSPTAVQQQQQQVHHHHSLAATDMGWSYSQPSSVPSTAPTTNAMNYVDLKPVKRSMSETTIAAATGLNVRHSAASSSGGMKIGSQISNFLRRKKRTSGGATAVMGRKRTPTAHATATTGGGGSGQGSDSGRGNLKGYAIGDVDESQEEEESVPPPTPPKDKGVYALDSAGQKMEVEHAYPVDFSYMHHAVAHVNEPESLILPHGLVSISEMTLRHGHSMSEYAVISHEHLGGHDERQGNGEHEGDIVVLRPEEFGLYGIPAADGEKPLPTHLQQTYGISTLKRGKWAEPQGLSAIRDPVERARMRVEIQKRKMEEEKQMLRIEEERQEMLKREKEESMRREEEEAERRKARIQAEALRVAAERKRREEMEREEEERSVREREERKRAERQKRMEEHLRLEEWRREQQRVAEGNAKAEEEERKRGEEERKKKIRKAEGEVGEIAREGEMTGWVTIQTDESVVWRRRHFKFARNTFIFYRSPKDLTQVLDRLDVHGTVKALKEPEDGYEDLKAIPHSFAIEFYDRGPWAMFADSEEEKYQLLGLLQYATRLV